MSETDGQTSAAYGTDRWGEPLFGDGIRAGSYACAPGPGQSLDRQDVFQVAFVGGRPDARGELVAFGWVCDGATGEWEPWWQSVGPNSVPTRRRSDGADEEQPAAETPAPCTCAVAGDCFAPAGHYADCPQAEEPAAVARQDGASND